jgi:hypothetical protein
VIIDHPPDRAHDRDLGRVLIDGDCSEIAADVRFVPESGQIADVWAGPLCAITGREQAQQRVCLGVDYSITSSARASSIGGISRPSPFAVATFMISSNFVGSSTGKSPGFVPLIIRPT